jgi:hypothetical protein
MVAKILTKGQEHAMIKQIEIHGQCFELYSPDMGAPGQAVHNRSLLKDVALGVTEEV